MTNTAPTPVVWNDRTDTAQQPTHGTPAARSWRDHVAVRGPRRRAHRQPITLDTIATRTAWAAAAIVILAAAAELRGPLAYIAVAVLAAALATRTIIRVHAETQRVSRLFDATKRR